MSLGRTQGSEFDLSVPVRSFLDVVVRVVLRPAVFFASIPRCGGLLDPLLFALICVEIATILGGVLGLLDITDGFGPIGTEGELGLGVVALNALLAPVVSTAGIFVGATFLHFLVLPIAGAKNSGFEASFRIISYSST